MHGDNVAALQGMGGIAVVGVGYQGRETHARTLSRLGLLAAVADVRREAADVAAGLFNVPAHWGPDAVEDLLGADSYAGVIVAVGSDDHARLAIEALPHTNVLVEKPFCNTPEEAEAMFDVAEQYGRILDAHHPLNEILPGGAAIARAMMRFGRMELRWRRQEGQPQTLVRTDPFWDLGSHLTYFHRAWLPPGRVPSELAARYGSYATTGDRMSADIHYPPYSDPAVSFELEGGQAEFAIPREHPALDVTLQAVYISPAMHAARQRERLTFMAEGPKAGADIKFATARGSSRGAVSFSIADQLVRVPLTRGRLSVAASQGPAIEHFLDLLLGHGVPYLSREEAILQATLLTKMIESASGGGRLIQL